MTDTPNAAATPRIHQDRLREIKALALRSGSHEEFADGMCVMESF